MSGLHSWRAGDPGAWNGETIPAAFSSSSPDVTTAQSFARAELRYLVADRR